MPPGQASLHQPDLDSTPSCSSQAEPWPAWHQDSRPDSRPNAASWAPAQPTQGNPQHPGRGRQELPTSCQDRVTSSALPALLHHMPKQPILAPVCRPGMGLGSHLATCMWIKNTNILEIRSTCMQSALALAPRPAGHVPSQPGQPPACAQTIPPSPVSLPPVPQPLPPPHPQPTVNIYEAPAVSGSALGARSKQGQPPPSGSFQSRERRGSCWWSQLPGEPWAQVGRGRNFAAFTKPRREQTTSQEARGGGGGQSFGGAGVRVQRARGPGQEPSCHLGHTHGSGKSSRSRTRLRAQRCQRSKAGSWAS